MHLKGPAKDLIRSNVKTTPIDRLSTDCGLSGTQLIAGLRIYQEDGKQLKLVCDDYEDVTILLSNVAYIAHYARKVKRQKGERVHPPKGYHLCPACEGKGEVMKTHINWTREVSCPDCKGDGEIENPAPEIANG